MLHFAEVPTSGHTAASHVSSVSGCVFTQKLVHFTEYLLCALHSQAMRIFYQRITPPPHFTLLFLFVPFVQFTDSPVATVTTAVKFDIVDVMCWRR